MHGVKVFTLWVPSSWLTFCPFRVSSTSSNTSDNTVSPQWPIIGNLSKICSHHLDVQEVFHQHVAPGLFGSSRSSFAILWKLWQCFSRHSAVVHLVYMPQRPLRMISIVPIPVLRPVSSLQIFRLTSPSQPNKVGLKCPYVRPSLRRSVHKKFLRFDNDIRYVGTHRWVMHDGMQYDSIQGQGHELLKVRNSAIFKGYLLPHL